MNQGRWPANPPPAAADETGLTEQEMFNMLGAGTRNPTTADVDRIRPLAVNDEAFTRALKRAAAEHWAERVRQNRTQQTQLPLGTEDSQ